MKEILLTYLPIAIILASTLGFIIKNSTAAKNRVERSKDQKYTESEEDSQIEYGRMVTLFEFLTRFPLTSKGTNQLFELVSSLGVYTVVEQKVTTARMLLTSYVLVIASVVVVYFLTDSLILRVGSLLLALVFRRDFINKKLRKERIAMREDLHRSMSSLRNEYERCYSPQKSFNRASIEPRAQMIFSNVSALFKSQVPDTDLAYFNQNNKDPYVRRFADLCFNTYYSGPAISKVTNMNTFISIMDTIMRDLQSAIDKSIKEKRKFFVAEKMPLLFMIVAGGAPIFLESQYPGLTYFFNSTWGYIGAVLSVLVITVGYAYVSNINDVDSPVDDTYAFENKLFEKQSFREFWEDRASRGLFAPDRKLHKSLSFLTPAMFKFRQTYMSIGAGVVALIGTLAYVYTLHATSVSDMSQFPSQAITTINERYDSKEEFMEKFVLDLEITDAATLQEKLRNEGLDLNETSMRVVTEIMFENRARYLGATYKPTYLFIVLVVMVIGYLTPGMLLDQRIKLVEYKVKLEILVLYAITVQIMYTPLKLRDYLKRYTYLSELYPKTHLDCYINQFTNAEFIKKKAEEMHDVNYYDLMDRLYTLRSDKTALEVFHDVEYKREYLLKKVDEAWEVAVNDNYTKLVATVTVVGAVVILFQLMIPLGRFAFTAFNQYGGIMLP